MSGFGYWSHDIGGFENTSTADVYKRWCAFGLLSSHSRLHGSTSYRVPWAYDEEAVDVVRFFTKLKAKLMPYLYRNAVETSKTGVPMMRSMVLEFTEDQNCAYLDKQYMYGDSLLVAPIFNDKSMANYYLPEGRWTNFFTGEVKEGGRWYKEEHSYLSIPLMVRPNSIIAVGKDCGPVYDYVDDVTFMAYELEDGSTVSTEVYNGSAEKKASISITKESARVTMKVESEKAYKVVLVNVKASGVEGAEFTIEGNNTMITANGNKEICCTL